MYPILVKWNIQELQVDRTEAIPIHLLNQVELGNAVDEKDALSYGAVSYYTLCYTDGETLTISPGRYFKVRDTYYEFKNYDALWDKFMTFNSIY